MPKLYIYHMTYDAETPKQFRQFRHFVTSEWICETSFGSFAVSAWRNSLVSASNLNQNTVILSTTNPRAEPQLHYRIIVKNLSNLIGYFAITRDFDWLNITCLAKICYIKGSLYQGQTVYRLYNFLSGAQRRTIYCFALTKLMIDP